MYMYCILVVVWTMMSLAGGNWIIIHLNKHVSYKRGMPWAKMALAKIF